MLCLDFVCVVDFRFVCICLLNLVCDLIRLEMVGLVDICCCLRLTLVGVLIVSLIVLLCLFDMRVSIYLFVIGCFSVD